MLNFPVVHSVLRSFVAQIFLKKSMFKCACGFRLEASSIIPLQSELITKNMPLSGDVLDCGS